MSSIEFSSPPSSRPVRTFRHHTVRSGRCFDMHLCHHPPLAHAAQFMPPWLSLSLSYVEKGIPLLQIPHVCSNVLPVKKTYLTILLSYFRDE